MYARLEKLPLPPFGFGLEKGQEHVILASLARNEQVAVTRVPVRRRQCRKGTIAQIQQTPLI